jgi:uncharacterized protein
MQFINYIRIHLQSALGVAAAQVAVGDRRVSQNAHTRAFALFAKAAKAGLPMAQYRLGHCYLMGQGIPASITEAIRWFQRAARSGDPLACLRLAELALQGVGETTDSGLFGGGVAEPDFTTAEHWCHRAIAAGSLEAKALLGFILADGPAGDRAAARQMYQEAAAAGSPRGQLGLALLLLSSGTPIDATHARVLLRQAATANIAAAHHILGMLAESDSDFPLAIDHYRQAADGGHLQAQVRYAFALLEGRGTPANSFRAETWLRKAALAGDAQAAAVLGYLYACGDTLARRPAEAVAWLDQAARSGHDGAARTLANILSQVGAGADQPTGSGPPCLPAPAQSGA